MFASIWDFNGKLGLGSEMALVFTQEWSPILCGLYLEPWKVLICQWCFKNQSFFCQEISPWEATFCWNCGPWHSMAGQCSWVMDTIHSCSLWGEKERVWRACVFNSRVGFMMDDDRHVGDHVLWLMVMETNMLLGADGDDDDYELWWWSKVIWWLMIKVWEWGGKPGTVQVKQRNVANRQPDLMQLINLWAWQDVAEFHGIFMVFSRFSWESVRSVFFPKFLLCKWSIPQLKQHQWCSYE